MKIIHCLLLNYMRYVIALKNSSVNNTAHANTTDVAVNKNNASELKFFELNEKSHQLLKEKSNGHVQFLPCHT